VLPIATCRFLKSRYAPLDILVFVCNLLKLSSDSTRYFSIFNASNRCAYVAIRPSRYSLLFFVLYIWSVFTYLFNHLFMVFYKQSLRVVLWRLRGIIVDILFLDLYFVFGAFLLVYSLIYLRSACNRRASQCARCAAPFSSFFYSTCSCLLLVQHNQCFKSWRVVFQVQICPSRYSLSLSVYHCMSAAILLIYLFWYV